MDKATLAQLKLIGLKIAIKMYKGDFRTNEGKISSTELLKTADEINNYLLKDFKDSSQDAEVHHEQVVTKKDIISKKTILWQKDFSKILKKAINLNTKFEKSVEKVKQKLVDLP